MIKDETVEKFIAIVESEYKIVLGISDARNILTGLVNFFDVLVKIDSRK